MRIRKWLLMMAVILSVPLPLCAQIDPYPRELLDLGYQRELNGRAPFNGYLYYELFGLRQGDALTIYS